MGLGSATAQAAPPTIEATWVTDVTPTSANLRARIDPEGLPTTYRFEYVTQAAFEVTGFSGAALAPVSGSSSLGAGTGTISVVQHVEKLSPTTTYRYRARANNGTIVLGQVRALTTEEPTSVFSLPDGRGWEMVSPVDKDGGAIASPESLFGGGAFQAAAGGGSATYSSAFSFAGAPGAPGANQYVSTRGTGGWSTANVTTPTISGSYGDKPDGVPYRLFSTDLSRGLLSNGVRCRSIGTRCPVANPPLPGSGAPAGYRNYYLRSGGGFQALLTGADIGALALGSDEFELDFAGATPDLAHAVLSSCAKLTPDATEVSAPGGCDEAERNLYAWSGGGLTLLNLLPAQATGTPGATLAAANGAISSDGTRVYFYDEGNLYLREGSTTKQVDGEPPVEGGGTFEAATSDGAVVFFSKEISPGDVHLYRYLVATATATDLTPGGEVEGVLAASGDGAGVYYLAATGLYAWHEGTTTQIAPGADAATEDSYPPATGTAHLDAAGTHLAFLSDEELTGYDNGDAETGLPDTELYLYGPPPGGGAPTLACVSCNPTGERPRGSTSIPGAIANGSLLAYRPRVLAAGGQRLFFDSADRLAIADTDSRPDVYEWEAEGEGACRRPGGCVSLISSGRSNDGASLVDASADGDDVFFLTGESLVGEDPGSIDLYDARVGGGFAAAQRPIACIGDACQALPSPPEDPTPGTLVPNGGNPPLSIAKPKPGKRKHPKHHHRRHHRKHRQHHRPNGSGAR
jgi:hypothetical protein